MAILLLRKLDHIADDAVLKKSLASGFPVLPKNTKTGDHNSIIYESSALVMYAFLGRSRLVSDGLTGVVADGQPTAADVYVLQEVCGRLQEVGYAASSDGSWEITNLGAVDTIVVAQSEEYGAGIEDGLIPGSD